MHLRTSADLTLRFVVFVTFGCFYGCGGHRNEITYKIIAPDQYTGWIRVDFTGQTPPQLDSGNHVAIVVGDDGTSKSDAVPLMVTNYEFFYQTADGLRAIPDDLVDRETDAGGFSKGTPAGVISWYFFIGPKTYRDQHPYHDYVSGASPLPVPGRIPATSNRMN